MKLSAERMLQHYFSGYTTPDGLLLDVLSQTSKREVLNAIALFPPDMLRQLERFVGYYTRKTKIFNGPRPNARTLRFVK